MKGTSINLRPNRLSRTISMVKKNALYSLSTPSQFLCPTRLDMNKSDNFRLKCLSFSEICAISCVLCLLQKSYHYQLVGQNVVFLLTFDTCDVVHN